MIFKEKINNFKEASANVRLLRTKFEKQQNNFMCYDTNDMICSDNPCDAKGASVCKKYDINIHCPYKQCPKYDWNTEHYNTYIKLCNAKMERFIAFLNLFKIK